MSLHSIFEDSTAGWIKTLFQPTSVDQYGQGGRDDDKDADANQLREKAESTVSGEIHASSLNGVIGGSILRHLVACAVSWPFPAELRAPTPASCSTRCALDGHWKMFWCVDRHDERCLAATSNVFKRTTAAEDFLQSGEYYIHVSH